MPHILALDEGTTSARAIIFDDGGVIRASAQREFRQIYPRPGWIEHDPREIWTTQIGVANEALRSAKLQPQDLVAILDTTPRARQRAEAGDPAFGTVESWLVWNLASERQHATDPSRP